MPEKVRRRRAQTPEAREQQMISYAIDLAEKQLIEGTAPATVIIHYLKLATEERKLEQMKIQAEIEASQAKAEQSRSSQRMEDMWKEAFKALREYQGIGPSEVDPNLYPSGEGFV